MTILFAKGMSIGAANGVAKCQGDWPKAPAHRADSSAPTRKAGIAATMTDAPQPSGQRQSLAPITLKEKPMFDRAFSRLAQPISDYTFANVYIWNAALRLGWRVIEEHLCIFANSTGDLTLMLPPLPLEAPDARALRRCLVRCFQIMDDYQHAHGSDRQRSRIEYVSDEMLEYIHSALEPGDPLILSASPFPGDYVYPTAAMIELSGKALKSKRHDRNRFVREHPSAVALPLGDEHIADCLELMDGWHRHADTHHLGQMTEDVTPAATSLLRGREGRACRMALRHHKRLGLVGLVVYEGSQLLAFTLGESLSTLQANILFEKTRPDCDGAAQFIFSAFCRLCWTDKPQINVGDDWGIPTLRRTKESYRPMRRPAKYTLARPVVEPTIRVAHPADAAAIVSIERACFGQTDGFNRRNVHDLLCNPRSISRVVEWNGRVIGWAVGLTRHHREHWSGRVYSLAVLAEYAGQGLGRLLTETLLEEMARRGVRRVYLEAEATNERALKLYEGLGFRYRRLLVDYYGPNRSGWSMWRTLGQACVDPIGCPEPPAYDRSLQ